VRLSCPAAWLFYPVHAQCTFCARAVTLWNPPASRA